MTDRTFDELKEEWWNPEGRLKGLHLFNATRVEYFTGVVERVLGGVSGKKVLDVGCGGGLLSEEFAKRGALVTGIDLSQPAIEVAREHAAGGGLDIDYRVATVGELKEEFREAFDCILCSEVIEHVERPEEFLKDCSALLKEGGLFLFSTINRTPKAFLLAIVVAERVLGLIPRGAHRYRDFLKPSELWEMLKGCGIHVEQIKGISFSLLEGGFTISDDPSVNYIGYGIKGHV